MVGREHKAGILPPWLWLWLVVYAFFVPGNLWSLIQTLSGFRRDGFSAWGEDMGAFAFFVAPPFLLLIGTVLAGMLTVLAPRTRAARLEKRFRITERPPRLPPALERTWREIEGFIREHAPGIRIKTNLLRQDQSAFVYPLGYRATAMAVFGGLLKLWCSDREAAEAILLHEIGHYRHGDALIVGAGSPFIWFFRYGALLALGSLLVLLASLIASVAESGYFSPVFDQPHFVALLVAVMTVFVAFWLLPVLILVNLTVPLVAIWCVELSADRFAAETQGSSRASARALHALRGQGLRWHRLFSLLSHPPYPMRRWMLSRYDGTGPTVILVLLFPVAVVVQSVLRAVNNTGTALLWEEGSGFATEYLRELGASWWEGLPTLKWLWISVGVLILVWPVAAGYWERLFCGRDAAILGRASSMASLICAVSLAGITGSYLALVSTASNLPGPGPLRAGEYSSGVFNPALSFAVDDGWSIYALDEGRGVLTLQKEDLYVHFRDPQRVFEPRLLDAAENLGQPYEDVTTSAPKDVAAWFGEHPNLTTTLPIPVSVGNVPGVQFDAAVTRAATRHPSECGVPCVPVLSSYEEGWWNSLLVGRTWRVLDLDADGSDILVIVEAPADGFERLLPNAETLLSTVTWDEMEGSRPQPVSLPGPSVVQGAYTTRMFRPALALDLGGAWRLTIPEDRDLFEITWDAGPYVTFNRVRKVYDPEKRNAPAEENTAPVPENLADWLRGHPNLDVGDPEDVKIGGASGVEFDARVSSVPGSYPQECEGPCLLMFRTGAGGWSGFGDGQALRLFVLDVDGQPVVVSVSHTSREHLEDALPQVEKMLRNSRWQD